MVSKFSFFQVIVLALAGVALHTFFPAVFGLLFVLFIPGFISTYALFRKNEIDRIERIAFSLGLSISLVVLTVMFSNLYLEIPVTKANVILQVSLLCAFFGSFAAARRSRAVMSLYAAATDTLMLRTGNPKRTLRFLAPTVIVLLLTVNILYPLVFSNADEAYGGEYIRYDPSDGSFEKADRLKISRPYRIGFDNALVFIGYDISQPLKRGKSAHINYYFKSEKDISVQEVTVVTDFSIDDNIVFQNQFRFPSIKQAKGHIVQLSNDIMIPNSVPAATYSMRISLLKDYSPVSADNSNEIGMINIPWYFDELYNPSMDAQHFYNGMIYNEMNITTKNTFTGKQRVYIFDNNIAFLGYDINPVVVSPGQEFEITYWWKALGSVDVDYTIFVHFIDSSGKIAFQHDHAPPRPTSEWLFWDVISEKYDVYVPSNADEGIYRIRFGLYDAQTGKRATLSSRNVRSNAPYLAQITVREKRLTDYYDGGPVRIFNTVDDTLQVRAVEVLNPVLADYGQIVVLGYALDALYCGETANLTYFVKALGVGGNYSIRTLITDIDGTGLIALDVPVPFMESGEVVAIVVAVDVPLDYGAGESLFTFGLRDDDTGEYVRGGRVVSDVVVVGG